jgi:MFS family permease
MQAGLTLDGSIEDDAIAAAVADGGAIAHPLLDLIRSPVFLLLALATAAYYLTYSGVLAHQAAVVQGEAASASTASLILGMTAGFAAVGALLIGIVIDRLGFAWVIGIQFSLFAIGVAALLTTTYTSSTPLLVLHGLCFGLAVGGSEPFWITMIRRRLPFALFQQAWGGLYFLELAFIIIGPFAAGGLYDYFRDYRAALWLELALIIVPLASASWIWARARAPLIASAA